MRRSLLAGSFCLLFQILQAQDTLAPFYHDVQAFKKQDSVQAPLKNAILLIGSSSFTRWTDVQDYFPAHRIVNRAFGGSTLVDLVRFEHDIVLPYKPKQVIIYCGENDIAGDDSITPATVLRRFKTLFQMIRADVPQVPVAFVSMKPSPSREKYWPKMVKANRLIRNWLATKPNTAFIDVYHKMFNKDGTVMTNIFVEDNLHMNAKGYRIWQKAMAPHLLPRTVRYAQGTQRSGL